MRKPGRHAPASLRQSSGDALGERGQTRVGPPIAAGQDVGCLSYGEPLGAGIFPVRRAAIDNEKRERAIDMNASPGWDLAAQRLAFLYLLAGVGDEAV
jgi:hypothetical protein